ncbi:hypothetical protein AVEN_211599-1, partial [Araneus ventricosus]
ALTLFCTLHFPGSFSLLDRSSIQGRDENHSSLSRDYTPGEHTPPIKLLQKLLGYNSIVRAGVVMNEDNSEIQSGFSQSS